ncbi:MAG: hypothetical protein IJ325_07140 [Clostridia bacterium]|nr:hypothetical protein [Clostridia bacterium]
MKLLVLTKQTCDLTDVLQSCGAEVDIMTIGDVVNADISMYDAYCVLGFGNVIDPRVRVQLEAACENGKHVFVEAVGSFLGIYSADGVNTIHSRLICAVPEENGIPGLALGDLLDDEANSMHQPYFTVEGFKPLLVYKERIIAHTHLNATQEEILKDCKYGLWMIGENVMMTSFHLHNFNKARFAPRAAWQKLIRYIAEWITGSAPAWMPEAILQYGTMEDISDDEVFEKCRREAIERGMGWLREFLVDEGRCGIMEGLRHNIDPEGKQSLLSCVRTDCSGEASGAFKFYAKYKGDAESREIAARIDDFIYGPMQIHGGIFDGLMRWTDSAWQVCYPDDAARAILPGLYDCLYLGDASTFPAISRALDFLVKATPKDGCGVWRLDLPGMTEEKITEISSAECGYHSAHYTAYYHAALLLAYKHCGKAEYLDTAKRGLETLMALYPETSREQSETEEMCRLVLPLAALYDATGEEKHREMLYRVVDDLETHKHPMGGFCEWDTGYKAACSRESKGECSLLTENGDPIADLLYSSNWLPIGFAYAYHVTGDARFLQLWRDIIGFCMRSQVISDDKKTNGSWCRGFDMDLKEAYGCPHDVGWAANASESGWTNSEILMGMMMPEILGFDAKNG